MSKGLTQSQSAILRWLDEHPDSVGSVDQLQETVRASRQSLLEDLRALEKRGLLKRVHYERWVKAT